LIGGIEIDQLGDHSTKHDRDDEEQWKNCSEQDERWSRLQRPAAIFI